MKKFRKVVAGLLALALAGSMSLTTFAATTPAPTLTWQVEHQSLARQIESEAILLLKNESAILPLSSTTKVAVFGEGQVSPPGGGGSGGAAGSFTSNLIDGLKALSVEYYEPLTEYTNARTGTNTHGWNTTTEYPGEWGVGASSGSGWSRTSAVQNPEAKLDDGLIKADGLVADARAFTDTAIVFLSRNTGVEEMDRNPVPQPSDWYLNPSEKVLLNQVSDKFSKIILIYTGTAPICLSQFDPYPIKAFITEYGAGQFHGLAMADILYGVVNPSAKLNDTLVRDYNEHPTNANWGYTTYTDRGYNWEGNLSKYGSRKFSPNDPISVYEEYIYMGYKYFDTFGKSVAYPFGFGLSYSTFSFTDMAISASQANKSLTVTAKINNTSAAGVIGGKEVMQVYVSKPQGSLEQAYQNLVSYDKTRKLESSESQTISQEISFYDFASYDESLAAYVLEPGDYIIRVGNSSRNTHVAGKFRVAQRIIVDQLSNQLSMQEVNKAKYETSRLKNAGATPITYTGEAAEIASAPVVGIDASFVRQDLTAPMNPTYSEIKALPAGSPTYTFRAVTSGEITLGEYVTQLTDDELLIFLSGGFGASYLNSSGVRDNNIQLYASDEPGIPLSKNNSKQTVAGGAGSSRSFARLGLPSMTYADGGSGIGFNLSVNGSSTRVNTGWARPAAMACIWNPDLYYKMGLAEGEEMVHANVDNWLAPSINMHRNPLCGRNLEYWSEDPVLAGKAVANVAKGVEANGVSVCLKHFAANDQEWFRRGLYTPASISAGTSKAAINVIAPERVLREIYLKPFEYAVKTGSVYNVMSAFNSINSQACASSPELLTNILRGEWGFGGYVVTDWGDYDDIADSAYEMAAGNDMIMSGTHTRYNIPPELKAGWDAGVTNRTQMLRNAYNVLKTAKHSVLSTDPTKQKDPGALTLVTTVLPDAKVGEEYSKVKVSPLWANGSADSTSYTFSLDATSQVLPTGLTLAKNGRLSGTPAVGSQGTYNLVFKVTDSLGNTATKALTLTVDSGLVFQTESLPSAKAAINYVPVNLQVAGGQAAVTFSVTNGTLPSGMVLDTDGRLWGQPSAEASGLYPVTVTATDGVNSKAKDFVLYVEGTLTPNPAAGTVLNAKENVPFTQYVTISGGFNNTLDVFEVSQIGDALPNGLSVSIDKANNRGVISGTPAVGTAGTYDVYIKVDEEFAGSPVFSYVHYRIIVGEFEADKDLLEAAIKVADKVVADGALDNVSEAAADELAGALADAKALTASTPTQEAVDAATKRLMDALSAVLVEQEENKNPKQDWAKYDEALQKAVAAMADPNAYTSASYTAFLKAFAACDLSVRSNAKLPQKDIDTAAAKLSAAVGKLVKGAKVTGVKLAPTSADLIMGKNLTLKATISPPSASNKTITWSSSKPEVATVSNGVVKGLKPGTATITAKTADGGFKAACTITVHNYVTLKIGSQKAVKNGSLTTIDNQGTKAIKISGRAMVPIRFVTTNMGGKVKYTGDKDPIIVTYGTITVQFKLGQKTMTITEGKSTRQVQMDVAAQKRNGRTFIPLRAVSQALGFSVYYQSGSEYVVVNNPAMTAAVRNDRLAEAKKLIK